MKILIISPTTALPANNGARRRIYHTVKELSVFADISFIALLQDPAEKAFIPDLKQICKTVNYFPWEKKSKMYVAFQSLFNLEPYRVNRFMNNDMRTFVSGLLDENEFDVIWVNFFELLSFLPIKTTNGVIIVDYHNDDFAMWNRIAVNAGSYFHRIFARINYLLLLRYNKKHRSRIDIGLAVSEEDYHSSLSWKSENTDLWLVPNGVDLVYFSGDRNLADHPVIIFCGALDMEMNVEAVRFFARNIFPGIRDSLTNCEFWIVGRDPDQRIMELGKHPGILIHASVPDVLPYYQAAWAAVSPYILGGGSKLKVLEAMAMGVPLVATTIGCQGIDVEDGKNILIADKNQDFSDNLVNLLRDEKMRKSLAAEGRKLVEDQYGWESIIRGLEEKMLELVNEKFEN